MTGIKVADASALAAILFGEPEAEAAAERLTDVTDARLAAPTLIDYELANVCLTKIRRQPGQREALRAAFRLAHRLNIEAVAIDQGATLDLAEATGLTAYDAAYLWLARSLGGELVTLDRKLTTTIRAGLICSASTGAVISTHRPGGPFRCMRWTKRSIAASPLL